MIEQIFRSINSNCQFRQLIFTSKNCEKQQLCRSAMTKSQMNLIKKLNSSELN